MITYHGLWDTLIPSARDLSLLQQRAAGKLQADAEVLPLFPVSEQLPLWRRPRSPDQRRSALLGASGLGRKRRSSPTISLHRRPAPARTRKICMYPNVPVYTGSGSTDDQANFRCEAQKKDDLIDALEIGKAYETSTKAIGDPD